VTASYRRGQTPPPHVQSPSFVGVEKFNNISSWGVRFVLCLEWQLPPH
jgi:hypothetical protein